MNQPVIRRTETLKDGLEAGSQAVLFVSGCLFTENSGPYLSMQQTARGLVARGHTVTVAGTRNGQNPEQPPGWPTETNAFRRYGPDSMHYAPSFKHWLETQGPKFDVVSMQGVWLHTNHLAAQWCQQHTRPYMITTHGNFNPQALRVSAWKKWLARRTFMRDVFANVSCYQASTEIEYETLRNQGIKRPVCVIGNGIEIPDLAPPDRLRSILPDFATRHRTCLYLGRLHPIKGIERLLKAWARLGDGDEWQLVIAGGGTESYRRELELVAAKTKSRNVRFVGLVSTEVKAAWLQAADFLVLPSFSEAFAMTPMEAFSFGTPAVLTNNCGFPEAARAGAAMEVPSSLEGIMEGLGAMLGRSPDDLASMGVRARAFVSDEYGWDRICRQLEEVYSWMRGGSKVPDCLRLD